MTADILCTGLERHLHHPFFIRAGGKAELAFALKQVGDRTVRAQIAAALAEGMTDLGHGAVAVVCHGFDQHCNTAGCIAFVSHLFDIVSVVGAGTPGYGAVDRIASHVGTERFVDRRAQARIVLGQWSALTCSDHQFADQLSEHLAASGILRCLAMLYIGPFTVAGHQVLLRLLFGPACLSRRPERVTLPGR